MQSVVLNRRDVREYDQMITLYTRDLGKREVLARGIKKGTSKNAAALMPFFLVDAEIVPGKDINHLTKVHIAESFIAIVDDVTKMQLLTVSFAGLDNMIHGEEYDAAVFGGLVEWLRFLNTEPNVQPAILDVWFLKMWAHLGLKIELDRCVTCGKREVVSISAKSGGVVCGYCAEKAKTTDNSLWPVTDETVNLLKLLLVKRLSEANQLVRNTAVGIIHPLVHAFIQYHSHRPLADWAKLFSARTK